MKRTRTFVGAFFTTLGFFLVIMEFAVYWYEHFAHQQHYDVNPWIMLAGTVIAFSGGALLDFRRAEAIVKVVVTATVDLARVLPFGRRATDKLPPATDEVSVKVEHDQS